MDDTINEANVKRCLVVFNLWQHFLADAATNNLSGHGPWAASLLRELRNLISGISLVSLNDFCGNCEAFLSQLTSDDIPKELPPISDFEKFEGSMNVLSNRISKCEVPIAYKFPLSSSKSVENLSSLSARFDKRIATASKLKELRFLMGKQNYYNTLGQVISVVQTKKSSTILRIWDGTIPQSTISTERSCVQLFRYKPENVVETLIEDKSGLLQNIPLHYCLDIDLYGRSLPMAKDLQAGDVVLVANVHLNWRKHEDYVIATLHDGEHEFKFNRGLFNVQPNHPRYFDLLGSLSNELCVANLSGLASMMESFSHDSRELREQAENSILRARDAAGGILSTEPNTNSNARLLEELQAEQSFISSGIEETTPPYVPNMGQTREGRILPQSLPSTSRQPANTTDDFCHISSDPTNSVMSNSRCITSMNSTQHAADSSISSGDLFLSIEDIMQKTPTDEANIINNPRRSTRLMSKSHSQEASETVKSATNLSAERSKTEELLVQNRSAASERNISASLVETIHVPTQDLNLTIECIAEDEIVLSVPQRIVQNSTPGPSQDYNLTIEVLDDINEGIGGPHSENIGGEDQHSYSSIAVEDLELSIEQLSDRDDSVIGSPSGSAEHIANPEEDHHDVTLTSTQDLELSMEELSSASLEIIESPPKRAKRPSSEAGSSHIGPAAVDKKITASKTRSDVTPTYSLDLELSVEELNFTPVEIIPSPPKRPKRSSETGAANNTPVTDDKNAVASRTRSHDRITRSKARTSGGKH